MERIVSHIEYLLDRHECVIIPGLGAFISRYEPARIDISKGIITAPGRTITFNSGLTHDDSLLASSYARAASMPYTVASSTLGEDVAMLKCVLDSNGEVCIGAIGTLYTDNEKTLTFIPSNSTYVNQGLREIKATIENQTETVSDIVVTDAPRRYNSTIHRVMRYAAMLVILLGTGIILSTPLTTPGRENVVKASVCLIETTPTTETFETEGNRPEFLIAEPRPKSVEPESPRDNYCLVIASLANIEQARQFMAQAGETAIGMFENNGRYRVYARTGASVADVVDHQLEEKYPGAWPCAMPAK
ncbi:MAG: hypothetical protein K2I52_05150 [Muribaculaceae bacterium]|nr:hypothetical protein [Muribaculaceae bacterium]